MEQSAQRIERSIGLVGNYASVSSGIVRRDDLGGDRHKRAGTSDLVNAWGAPLAFLPATVGGGPGNNAFIIQQNVPEKACVPLVSSMARRAFDVRVNGVSVLDNEGGGLDVAAASAACKGNNGPLQFVFYSGIAGNTLVAAPPLTLPPAPPGVTPPTSPPIGGPVGPVGPVGPAAPVAPVAPAPVSPVPAPAVPPPSGGTPVTPVTPGPVSPAPGTTSPPTTPVAACVAPPNRSTTEGQTRAICPAGQYGQITEQRVGTYSYSCPEAWDRPVETFSWAGWTVTSNTCTTCPGDENRPQQEWRSGTRACPSGQQGTVSFEYLARIDRTFRYNCPAGTATLPAAVEVWNSGWYATGAEQNVNTSGCSSPGLVVTSGTINLSVANASRSVGTLTLAETTNWTYLVGQSSSWSSSWGPVRGSGQLKVSYNGASATVSGSGSSSSTARPGSPAGFTASNQTINFNGKLVEFEFRGNSTSDGGSVINGSVSFYYRLR